jgi:spore germination protein YaaH
MELNRRKMTRKLVWLWLIAALMTTWMPLDASAANKDLTTKYRVYQNYTLLQEFADREEAIRFAGKWANSYVEEIGTRRWIWSQFPKYEVYVSGTPIKRVNTLQEAIAEASGQPYASVRNIESIGWEWHNYPRYQVYQGEFTQDSWLFTNLDDAIREAKRWADSFIIDLETNRWVWDQVKDKESYRSGDKVYKVYQINYSRPEWEFAYLEDAINEALRWEHSYIVNTAKNNRKVFSNENRFTVYQYNTKLDEFVGLNAAIAYAQKWDHSRIIYDGKEIWNNYPYYRVFQDEQLLKDFHTPQSAQAYALEHPKSVIRTLHGLTIWDNSTGLQVWAWNGEAKDETVFRYVEPTRGLDVNSPTWFILNDASGNVRDLSSEAQAEFLKKKGIDIFPLVHNQFSADLTSRFLNDRQAQQTFIRTVVDRSAQLGAKGINLDFEGMRGSDRSKFTQFVRDFAAAAHEKGLLFSIDLPRGSVRWNHQTAFDHAELANIADYIVIMAYDQYYSGSTEPGPVSAPAWAEEGVREFLSYGIPRSKLILGIPFYIRQWKLDANGKLAGNSAIFASSVRELLETYPHTKQWDERYGLYRIEYRKDDGYTYVFWLEDEETLQRRIDIAKTYNLAGVAAWRLGYEPETFWDVLAAGK